MSLARSLPASCLLLATAAALPAQVLDGCPVFPPDHVLNARVDELPVHPLSLNYVASIGGGTGLHADFGSGDWPAGSGNPIGIPYVVVDGDQPPVAVSFTYSDESDPGPYPVPPDAPIEGGASSTGDRHVLVVDRDACRLYELFGAYPNGDGTWQAGSGAVFDLASHALRPAGWTSADAAGLPILPLLVRYDEVAAGEIRHAIRFTAARTQRAYVWPARHFASSSTNPALPPMGQRFRLRASVNESGFSPPVRVIVTALKRYGLILADNGANWYLSGVPDPRWDDDQLRELQRLTGNDFEAVDASLLQVSPDSARARSLVPRVTALRREGYQVRLSLDGLLPGTVHFLQVRHTLPGSDWSGIGTLDPQQGTAERLLPALSGDSRWIRVTR